MRRGVALLVLAMLATGGGVFYSLRNRSPQGAAVSTGGVTMTGVEALMEHPERFSGRLQITGVVGRVLPERQMFLLADLSDREELLQSGETRCVTLPVRWMGTLPAVHEDVVIRGEVHESDGKLLFVASAVEKSASRNPAGNAR